MNEKTNEILGKLSEMSESVHSTLRELQRESENSRETLLASIQPGNSETLENEPINWVLLSIITVALIIFAISMSFVILYLQRKRSNDSEPTIQINA